MKARTIDMLVAVAAVAFVLAEEFDLLGPAATWAGLAALAFYLGWFLKRRSPYRDKPGDLHLNA